MTRVLSSEEFEHAKQLARSALAAGMTEFVEDWKLASREAAQRGRHEAARDALLALKVIEPPQTKPESGGLVVKIGVALPGLGLATTDEPITVNFSSAPEQADGRLERSRDSPRLET